MRRGLSGRLHSGQSRLHRVARKALAQVRSAHAKEGPARRAGIIPGHLLRVRCDRQELRLLDDRVDRCELASERIDLRADARFGLFQLSDAFLELVTRAVYALDAFKAPAQLEDR